MTRSAVNASAAKAEPGSNRTTTHQSWLNASKSSPCVSSIDRTLTPPYGDSMTSPAPAARLDSAPLTLPARPLVSIVIPCLNEEDYITALLDSLSAQDYGADGIEVLVSDGGSTDRTRDLVRAYPSRFARLELVDNPRR